jgi:prepilin-type N-terminal cleavage/methylation domain-containing protein
MKNQKKSKAFTLLELIISIIVIGIIMVTIPLFLQTLISSSKVTNKEEVFFSQFSLLSLINTKYFDENNTVGDNFYKDLNTSTNAHPDLRIYDFVVQNSAGRFDRKGKYAINNNILRSGSKDSVSVIGLDSGENPSDTATWDDIDDFDGYEENISVGVTSSGYSMKVEVDYLLDNPSNALAYNDENITMNIDTAPNLGKNGLTNIKLIKITTTFSDGSKVVLEYPTYNIGASKMLSLEEITR